MKHLALVLLLTAAVLAQDLPLVARARVTDLTPLGYQNEPSIAINPANPQQLVVGYQINASIAWSVDGGATWKLAHTAPADYKRSGDPSVTFDSRGHAIFCYIAFDKLGTTSYWGHNATRNGIFIKRSLDGGKTWEPKAVTVVAHESTPGIPFEDKPYIVADTQLQSPHRGNLYVGWTRFTMEKTVILLSRSVDGGLTWSKAIEISTHPGLPRDDNGALEGFTGTVAGDGTLYVVWSGNNVIELASSEDGGQTFTPSRPVIEVAPPFFDVSFVSRANGFPQIGWGPCAASDADCGKEGRLLLTWSDYRHGDVDIFSATSTDRGHTWSKPVRVNSDPLHNGRDQFFQWLAVDPSDGAANVIFYDRRTDPANAKATVVLARSTDGGRSFTNYAWTQKPFTSSGDFLGDYTGIAALNGRVYGAWAEERSAKVPAKKRGERSKKDETGSAHHATLVRVGSADFNSSATSHP